MAVLRRPESRAIEPVGDAHYGMALAALGRGANATDDGKTAAATSAKKKRVVLTPETYVGLNYYELLDLDPLGVSVDGDMIKRAYHRALLTYHPDKTGRGDEDEVFLAIQDAYNTLSNEGKRRAYDSQNEFDDAIPSGREPGDFFEVFGPVFRSNARFATKLPVPELGDADTPMDEVRAFYEYWMQFESWRDFSLAAQEHDLDQADSREERRWMMKENERGVKGLKKKEYQRISTLVDRARARDPRIIRAGKQEREAKRAAKAAKAEERERKAREEREAAEKAAREAAEAEAKRKEETKAAKLEREKEKKYLRRCRASLRKLIQAAMDAGVPEEQRLMESEVELLCDQCDVQQLEQLNAGLGGDVAAVNVAGLTAVHDALATARQNLRAAAGEDDLARERKEEARKQRLKKAAEEREAQRKAKVWTSEEASMLAKAVRKFPAGQMNRWLIIANYVNDQLNLQAPKTKEDCLQKYQQVQAAPAAAPAAANATNVPPPAPAAAKATAKAAAPARPSGVKAGATEAAPKTSAGAGGPNAARRRTSDGAPVGGDTEWTQAQQAALEAALLANPVSKHADQNERWKAIARAVVGKTKKQCVERYKHIRSALQKKT